MSWLLPTDGGAPPLGWGETAAYLILPVLLIISQARSVHSAAALHRWCKRACPRGMRARWEPNHGAVQQGAAAESHVQLCLPPHPTSPHLTLFHLSALAYPPTHPPLCAQYVSQKIISPQQNQNDPSQASANAILKFMPFLIGEEGRDGMR